MVNLMRASEELFRRRPDERFATLDDLYRYCSESKAESTDRWCPPAEVALHAAHGGLQLSAAGESLAMNDWSFSQACSLAKVSKDTINKLSPETAARVFAETWPDGSKPLQVFTTGRSVRSIHGASYTRLHNVELLSLVREFATDFGPAQQAMATDGSEQDNSPATGLYCGEQDMFCFLIDPTGWTEIDGEAFAPGFFLWNSEVGRRTVGIQTFWFQAVCQNHIVWDAVDVVEFSRKHTANVHECLGHVRQLIERLVNKRDERRDGFVQVVRNAMRSTLGNDADEALKVLSRHGIPRTLGTKALEHARMSGQLTIFSVVAALTELVGKYENAGDRTALDTKSSSLLSLAV